MTPDDRKKQIAYAETMLKKSQRKLHLAATLVRRWQSRLRTQEKAYQRDLELRITDTEESSSAKRRFRN